MNLHQTRLNFLFLNHDFPEFCDPEHPYLETVLDSMNSLRNNREYAELNDLCKRLNVIQIDSRLGFSVVSFSLPSGERFYYIKNFAPPATGRGSEIININIYS